MTGQPMDEAPELSGEMDESFELRLLFHRLQNELGIILANAELLKAKATDDTHRARAAQVAASVIDAMETAKELRSTTGQLRTDRRRDYSAAKARKGCCGVRP